MKWANLLKKLTVIFLACMLILYLIWEFYWYTKVGLGFIKWHTHLMLYVYLGLISSLFIWYVSINFSKDLRQKLLLFTIAIFSTLFTIEFLLWNFDINKTYTELVGEENYISPYSSWHTSYYHIRPAELEEYWIETKEFKHWRPINSLGFTDKEWDIEKEQGVNRVLCLGDSFTEGAGAAFDSTYPAKLNRLLKDENPHLFEVMNAGVSGSDPFFDFVLLRDKLIFFRPDYVIQNLSSQDLLTDVINRGGFERFQESRLVFKRAPWWEPMYALSLTGRFFFHALGYNKLLRKEELSSRELIALDDELLALFKQYTNFCAKNEMKLLIFLRPDIDELKNGFYNYNFDEFRKYINDKPAVTLVDLLPVFKREIKKGNLKMEDIFWVRDGHHNAKGYEIIAKKIFTKLNESN